MRKGFVKSVLYPFKIFWGVLHPGGLWDVSLSLKSWGSLLLILYANDICSFLSMTGLSKILWIGPWSEVQTECRIYVSNRYTVKTSNIVIFICSPVFQIRGGSQFKNPRRSEKSKVSSRNLIHWNSLLMSCLKTVLVEIACLCYSRDYLTCTL